MVILHNPLDKDSREFVAKYGAGHTILEYPDCVQKYPYISCFPSVVVAEYTNAHYICAAPKTWQDVEAYRLSLIDDITFDEQERVRIALTAAVQSYLDANAKSKGYDGILSAASYAGLPVGEPFQAEGLVFAKWRSAVWIACYSILADVQAGVRSVPTEAELLGELPAVTLP